MICPICKKPDATAGHILGHGAAGKPKNFSAAEISRRKARMKEINARKRAARINPPRK